MSEWKIAKLTEVAAVFNGKTPSKLEQRTEGHPVLKIKDVSELGEYRGKFESFVDPELATKFANKQVQEGDTLILNAAHSADYVASKTYHAQPATFGALATGEWLIVRPDRKALDAKFAHHWVNSTRTRYELRDLVNGIHLYPKDVARLQIPLPPLEEQKRIAEILDRAEELRSKRREAIAQLDTLIKAIFLEMFGNPVTNPKGFTIRKIKDLLESASYGTSEKSSSEGEFPVLRMNNITRSGEIDLTDLKYMDLADSQKERYLVRSGDVLFNRTNSAELVGKTAIIRNISSPMAFAGYLVRLRVNKENDPEYLSAFLNTDYSKRVLRGMCKSIIGMANINASEVQTIKIAQPPLHLQQEFARRVEAVEKLKAAHRASLSELDALFASLQHRAFRGEL
ncbi:restriction endonuclease subunit S [Microcoleus sp. F8_C2]